MRRSLPRWAGIRCDPLGNGAWAVRVQIKPLVRWIWAGAFLMALGGFVTALDRRFRRVGRERDAASAVRGDDRDGAAGAMPARGGEH